MSEPLYDYRSYVDINEGDCSEQWSPSNCFLQALDIKFSADRVRHECLRFSITDAGVPYLPKISSQKFLERGYGGDSLQCREMSEGQRVAGAVGANLFSKRFSPKKHSHIFQSSQSLFSISVSFRISALVLPSEFLIRAARRSEA